MDCLEISSADGARAELYSHGAHVTSWKPASGEERLFLSGRSSFEPGTAMRGGVPVVFPQFSSRGPLLKHGFARVVEWETVGAGRTRAGKGEARLRLTASDHTRSLWDHDFETNVIVTVGGMSLSIALSVLNPGRSPFTFTAALHTYLLVDDVRRVVVAGLEGMPYEDAAAGAAERRKQDSELAIEGEVDRVYYGAAKPVEVRDATRKTRVSMTGFTDVVVWNPGAALAARLSDLEPGGWQRMLCVEAAVIGEPVTLQPEERWTGQQTLTAL